MDSNVGRPWTTGSTFRARAEARQREPRSRLLGFGWAKYGHLLTAEAVDAGANFVVPQAFAAAQARQAAGKGVAQRTFDNTLSSQAMCLSLLARLAEDLALAAAGVLGRFITGLTAVRAVNIEFTPAADLFGDQSGRGGARRSAGRL